MAPANGAAWEVTAQREDWRVAENGQAGPGMVVEFRLKEGPTGSIFVAAADYTVERVRQAIDAKAREMAAIHALKG